MEFNYYLNHINSELMTLYQNLRIVVKYATNTTYGYSNIRLEPSFIKPNAAQFLEF